MATVMPTEFEPRDFDSTTCAYPSCPVEAEHAHEFCSFHLRQIRLPGGALAPPRAKAQPRPLVEILRDVRELLVLATRVEIDNERGSPELRDSLAALERKVAGVYRDLHRLP